MTRGDTAVERLFEVLGRAGEQSAAVEVAEMLWLAARLPARRAEKTREPPLRRIAPPPAPPPPTVREPVPPGRDETFGPTATATTASARSTTGLYPTQAGTVAGGAAARTIRSPGALALPGTLELGRSLRPLKRRVPSRTQIVLDEDATAHRIADTGQWTPVFNPAPERWLDVVLVVDESSSMIIWQRTVAELEHLLECQGAFRNVQTLGLRPRADNQSVEIYTGIGPMADRARLRRPAELIDPLGRRLIAVVSDCVSPAWHNGVMATVLSAWGESGLITLVQVLPDRLWVRTGLRTCPSVYLRSPVPGAPNSTFEIEWTNYRPNQRAPRGTAVPVVSLQAAPIDYWARAMAGNSNLWIPGAFAMPAVPVEAAPLAPPPAARAAAVVPAEQLVRTFYGTASPTARRLASMLAAVPLTLPVMRLVQRALLPESRQVHLAEVWLSGLINRPAEIDDRTSAENVEYLFVNGVRELLLKNLRLDDVLDVLGAVSAYVGERAGQALDFAALIADPHASGDLQISQGYRSFARVAASALRRFGGQYEDVARRLEISVYGESVPAVEAARELRVEAGGEAPAAQAVPAKDTVRVHALLVGTSEHANISLPPLAAQDDVLLTKSWLEERCGVARSDIRVLLGKAATKQAVVDSWRKCARRMKSGEQFFFYFSGYDQTIPSDDPNEADGLEETLFVYDSAEGGRSTLLSHQDLADLAAEVEQRGGQAILLLDSCRTASGLLARRGLRNTLVFAGAAEMEVAYETSVGKKRHGALSYFVSQAMEAYRPGMTWLEVHDQVLARLHDQGLAQTPQLIGAGDLTVFGSKRRPVSPYLVVKKGGEREIEVRAPAALHLGHGRSGARLAIYPPGSAMDDSPVAFARVTRSTDSGVAAVLESTSSVSPASRARVLEPGDERPVIRVGLDEHLLKRVGVSPLVAFGRENLEGRDFTATVEEGDVPLYVIRDAAGLDVWSAPASTGTREEHARRLRETLEHLAGYLRTLTLENRDVRSDLGGKIDLELISPADGEAVTLAGAEPLMLRLRNRADRGLYVSVWMLDPHLGVERIFPSTTCCVLLGAAREVTLAVAMTPHPDPDRPMPITFKVFASDEPADLGLLTMSRLDTPFELGRFVPWWRTSQVAEVRPSPRRRRSTERRPAVSARKKPRAWAPGGPCAVTAKAWKTGQTLRIKFLSGDSVLRKRVIETASEWTRYANLHFKVVRSGDTELRVDFGDAGSWSYLGKDSLVTPKKDATINLGELTGKTPDSVLRPVVLHEFGHALGLVAANQSPVATIPWNKKATYEYFGKVGWDKATVDANFFFKYDPRQVTFGPPDSRSVMYHPVPSHLTGGKFEIKPGTRLSEGDKQFIAQLYPAGETRRERIRKR